MAFLLARRLLSSSPSSVLHHQHHQHHQHYQSLILLSFSTQPLNQKETNFIAKYLVSSLGFSPHQAVKVSANKRVSAIKSEDQPDSVVGFLKDTGLSAAQIRRVVSSLPVTLASNVEKGMKPKVRALADAGISGELLVALILFNPHVLFLEASLSHVLFWREFAGNDNQALLKMIKRNSRLITYDIDKHVVPRMNLLEEYGLSNSDLLALLKLGTRCIGRNLGSLRQALELTEELGIPRESKMFRYGIRAVSSCGNDKINMRIDFLKRRYGWSQEEVCTAFRRSPMVLTFSEEKLKSSMDFLITKAGFEPRKIALYPRLIGCSVERVLIPRHTVLSALRTKGLRTKRKCCLATACRMSERSFYESFVAPFEEHVPDLSKTYYAALGAKKQD